VFDLCDLNLRDAFQKCVPGIQQDLPVLLFFINLYDMAVEVYYNCPEIVRIIMSLVQGNCLTVLPSFSFRGE